MLDAGGDPVERETERRPLKPVYRRPSPPRPTSRPVSVWVIALVLVVTGLLGVYIGTTALLDAVDHGDEGGVIAAFGLVVLLSVAQLVVGGGLFAGTRWGRTGALTLCAFNLVLTVIGAMQNTLTGVQLWLALAVNLVLIFALLGPQVYAWTGGGPTRT